MYIPTIFIGSSKEGKLVAEAVKNNLDKIARCQLWYDGFFDVNDSTLNNLYKKIIGFDFAIFIGTKDDLSKYRGSKFKSIRDNVIFEYGLFTGGLGIQRTYCLIEKGAKLPSDLTGITLLFYNSDQQLQERCNEIRKLITKEIEISRISMLPSTASAIAYHENFIKPVCSAIDEKKTIVIEGKSQDYDKSMLNIVIPLELKNDLKPYAKKYYEDNNLLKGIVDTYLRERSVYFGPVVNGELKIFDIPTVLNTSYIAIDLFIGKDYIGYKQDLKIYRDKELQNFKITLHNLICEDALTNRYTIIKEESNV